MNTTTTVYYLPRFAYFVLIVDLGVLLGDCLICMWTLVAHQPLMWYLPATMGLLIAVLLILVATARKVVL